MLSKYDWRKTAKRLELIDGSTTRLEVKLLYQLARERGKGVIVELGSFLGKSTIALASGSLKANGTKVYAVDPHRGDAVINKRFSGPTYRRFWRNIKAARVADMVVPIKKTSREAIKSWKRPIRLLFIDGDHSFLEVAHDVKQWGKFVAPQGVIALHDALNPGVGPPRAIVRQLISDKNWSRFGVVESIFYGYKSPPQKLVQWINWYFWALTMRLVERIVSLKLKRGVKQLLIKRGLKPALTWVTQRL